MARRRTDGLTLSLFTGSSEQLEVGVSRVSGDGDQIVTLLPDSLILPGPGGPDLKSEDLVIQHGQSWPLDFMQRLEVRPQI